MCLKLRLCAFAIGTQTKHMAKAKQMRNWQRRKQMIETPLCVCNWHADKTHGKSKEGNKMIETNSWQKPSACDTPSRSKEKLQENVVPWIHSSLVPLCFRRATVLRPPLWPRKRSLKIRGNFIKCIWKHASRPYRMCLDGRGFYEKRKDPVLGYTYIQMLQLCRALTVTWRRPGSRTFAHTNFRLIISLAFPPSRAGTTVA